MKTYIWAIPTRIFHWLLAIGFVSAYILGDFVELQNLHFGFGALVGILILFRLLYGFFGPKYSHFRDFPIGIKNQVEFVKTFFNKTKVYAGHIPAASLVMLSIFIIGFLTSCSGFSIYALENGIFNLGIDEDFLEEAHEILANLFFILVIIHLIGVLIDVIFHSKTKTLLSIITGYKNVEDENVKLTMFHKIFSIIWFIIPFIFFVLAYNLQTNNQENMKTENYKETPNNEEEEDEDDD